MDPELIRILHHSLGMKRSNYRRRLDWWYDDNNHRNFYCGVINNKGAVEPKIASLLEAGMMQAGRYINNGACRYYHVTDDGIRAAKQAFTEQVKIEKANEQPILDLG